MEYRQLGNTDINVSIICLGSMMWGSHNNEAEAHQQLDYAIDRGVNFIDTAELYAIPPDPDTQGLTEQFIGNWLANRIDREKLIIATKVTGRSRYDWIRDGEKTRLTPVQIKQAVEGSLKRLKTDYIDLYQLHWPDRRMNNFGLGSPNYQHYPDDAVPLHDALGALGDLVKEGKIRHIGLSNETPWGLSKSLQLAKQHELPQVVSVQNAYNLLNRSYELGLSEFYFQEQVGLLAYSPLAQGFLSGKYVDGGKPSNSRKVMFARLERYEKPGAEPAIKQYLQIARDFDLSPVQMALAFVNQQAFVTANIIGATSLEQLKEDIDSTTVTLGDEVLEAINKVHLQSPNPCP